ncbi:Haloacid dehalogenase type II [Penicillium bovifimosum]|uniref:Haloacid dehalogenase type II n=1 Tax=Penicillium bovifimosum TaxID=126998 RepID=A0A9W9L961_9EURO|nr:Haloacid dehalogenase type II [Penicillium bovifimosum]KAJ5143129.1 Haloacid dehalogenase type II [Penicillium bovifimosum]
MSTVNVPQVLFFDVFGTVAPWRTSISEELSTAAQQAVNDPRNELPADVRDRATAMTTQDWLEIANEWRWSYVVFTRTFDSSTEFMSVDQHHYKALQDLLRQRGLDGLFTDEKRWDLAFAWHRLSPWPDSAPGLELLNRQFTTATLSNGNVSLLEDLQKFGSLPFKHIVSAENFGAYKPSPLVYGGAAKKFGMEPNQCGLVAAHLGDLKAAKDCGFQTIYVERELEEHWSKEETEKAKAEGWVNMWIDSQSPGFLEVARRFGIE